MVTDTKNNIPRPRNISALSKIMNKKSNAKKKNVSTNKKKESYGNSDIIIEIDPSLCKRWKFSNRQEYEFGTDDEIKAFDDSIKMEGQLSPGLVRIVSSSSSKYKYEIIYGVRRWDSCKRQNLKFKVIVKDLSDDQAFKMQAIENEQRNPVSPYSDALQAKKYIEYKELTLTEFSKQVGKSLPTVSGWMLFFKVPDTIWENVGDMSKVSYNVARTIHELVSKNKKNIQKIIDIADKIRDGAGKEKIINLIEKDERKCNYKNNIHVSYESHNGNELFIYNPENLTLKFNKETLKKINLDKINDKIMNMIDEELSGLS
ncbi:ParB/RepB/Spo0J family partition protein [Piscirickettsia salmonis]|uniref:ParB/RepB/Spo0J family partition protein n=1 Tax=Piscirickettsia salmonis TaxID=1238 RepID=UPI0002DB3003|nr:ParB/RepB/Spo0J family partition protein [Piscirickettsia salmonis]APS57006.1 hypothetical protein AVI52_06965 [Piscirickettsia salmonis]ERL60783.1 parB/RepB/Spo0J family partition domain protein [Piscirickettsia salmonis LF-89 = ATCC VR-1361]PEQ16559.1 hypothetical protein X973_06800 [Piscirickettsia salmonis]QGN78389.1 Nucleoid occlusion protein [Piscirickettsia salmonis]QGN81972.1 Nucleoid occlusion protein [Piscirickettsia salmonis]